MPRKSRKSKKKSEPTNTYYKAKNGRFYKKIQIDGKTRVRFVTNAEAMGTMKSSTKPAAATVKKAKRRTRKKKDPQPEEPEPGAAPADEEKSD